MPLPSLRLSGAPSPLSAWRVTDSGIAVGAPEDIAR